MENAYFKMIGQKAGNGKLIMIFAIDEDLIGDNLPEIFEVQGLKLPATIYTGIYPQLKILTNTIVNKEYLAGKGIDGIITSENWYCARRNEPDIMGIGL